MINITHRKTGIAAGKGILAVSRPFSVKREWDKFRADGSCKQLYLTGDSAKTWKEFRELFRLIIAAGGLVQNSDNKFLVIFRNKKWDLPKGKRDKGETVRHTAIREVEEECGIGKLKITDALPCTYHIYELKGKMALKKTFWFAMKTASRKKLVPQREEGIEKALWLRTSAIRKKKKQFYPSVWDLVKDLK